MHTFDICFSTFILVQPLLPVFIAFSGKSLRYLLTFLTFARWSLVYLNFHIPTYFFSLISNF